ncbi:MAG: hypothetical protein NC833_03355 [Candidatus Omnitrophica bacterium]|nr:hypothetical protein [Candidatus Omnitrophota bacterium]
MKFKLYFFCFFLSIFLFSEEIKYKCDSMKVDFDQEGQISRIFLQGNVIIVYKDLVIKTEKAVYDRKKNEIECEKGGKILSELGEIKSDYFKYNIIEEEGIIYNVKFKSEPFYGKAERVKRQGDFLRLENGYITTCDLEKPHYKVNADKIEILKDNYIRGEKMRIVAGEKFNLFYLPKYTIDMKTKKPFFSYSFGHKTRVGTTITLSFNHKMDERKDYLLSQDLLIGNKGFGISTGFFSEKNNIEFDSLFFKRWEENEIQQGAYLQINKNFENIYLLFDWRWMYDNDFFVDFFKEQFLEKSKMYNYFSITSQLGKGTFGFIVRENAREKILKIEKLPEIRYFLPYIQFSDIPFYLTYDFRFTNFYNQEENYFRILNDFDFTFKKDLKYFNLKPYISFSFLNYEGSDFDKFNYIGEAGVNLSTIFNFLNKDIYFIPKFSLYTRKVNHKPNQLIQFDEFEEKNNGSFFAVNLRWDVNKENNISGNFEIENEYDISRNLFGNLFLRYEFGGKEFKIEGDNEWNIEDSSYKFGVNSISYEKEKYKFSIGTRLEDESNIFGIETWLEQKIKSDWKYRIGFFYDFNSDDFLTQTYEIWKKIHCLTVDFRITKDRENFYFYIFVVPSIFFENNWQRRYTKWK